MFVAGFIGSPAMNMLEATVTREAGATSVVAGEMSIGLSEKTLAAHPALQSTRAGQSSSASVLKDSMTRHWLAMTASRGSEVWLSCGKRSDRTC